MTMHRALLLLALGSTTASAVLGAAQAPPPSTLSQELRAHVRDERFQIVTSLRGLPLGVRSALQTLFGSPGLDIAEPGDEFQAAGAAVRATLPLRRLVVAGCSYEHCLVYYELGGVARTWRVALFHWTPNATRFEGGGTAPAGLTTIDDVRRVILSGASTVPAGRW
jgi:hypothetical protein